MGFFRRDGGFKDERTAVRQDFFKGGSLFVRFSLSFPGGVNNIRRAVESEI